MRDVNVLQTPFDALDAMLPGARMRGKTDTLSMAASYIHALRDERDTLETERDGWRGRSPSPGHSPRVNMHPVRKISHLVKLRFIDNPEDPTEGARVEQSTLDGYSGEVPRRASGLDSPFNGTTTPPVGPPPVPLSPSLNILP
jgi:hypothetical protein